jgi:hypothetical protein
VKDSFRRQTPADTAAPSEGGTDKEARKEAITRFILTLSDQQLVTGLAILIAAVAGQKRLTGYEFDVALSLAWFSSITHMATLDALRKYFRDHHVICHLRVVGMLTVLSLLTYTFRMSIFQVDNTLPIQCVYLSPETDSITVKRAGTVDSIGLTSFSLVLLLIISGYFIRIQGLYFNQRDPSYAGSWLIWKLRCQRSDQLTHAQLFLEYQSFIRVLRLQRIDKASGFKRNLLAAMYTYQRSYLFTVSGIVFSYTYGIAQVIQFRWLTSNDLTKDASYIGFGQITALFLLCLPFLTAGETYSGEYLPSRREITRLS